MRNLSEDEPLIYLNNAAMARLSPEVQQAGIRVISDPMQHSDADLVTSIRRDFATLIGASPECIAIMPSTAYAITLAAHNLARQWTVVTGKILVLQDQMCSAIYPWQEVCDLSGGRISLEIVPYPKEEAGETWTQSILQRLNSTILAVCLPPLHWSDGCLIDLVTIGNACWEQKGGCIPLIVDATQAIGALPLSVAQIRPVFLACSVHKWLRAPAGVSLVYIHRSLFDLWTPLDQNGRGREVASSSNWDAYPNAMGPAGYPTRFLPDARKLDCGGRPNPILLPMLRESLRAVVSTDASKLQSTLKETVQPLLDWVETSEHFMLPSHHGYHLMGLRSKILPTKMLIEICSRLQNEFGIYVIVRCGALRVSPYMDNTTEDIEAFVVALQSILSTIG